MGFHLIKMISIDRVLLWISERSGDLLKATQLSPELLSKPVLRLLLFLSMTHSLLQLAPAHFHFPPLATLFPDWYYSSAQFAPALFPAGPANTFQVPSLPQASHKVYSSFSKKFLSEGLA